MERRELLKMIAVLTGSAMIGGDFFLTGCKTDIKKGSGLLSASQIAVLDEVGETILPATNTPGAKAVKIGEFMNVFVTDCYRPEQQKTFTDGLANLDELSKKQFNKKFISLSPEQRNTVLMSLEPEAKEFNKQLDDREKSARGEARLAMKEFTGEPPHYYTLMKQLTLVGYFTSEIGNKEALRFLPIPGKYDGAYPYKKGDKAWAI